MVTQDGSQGDSRGEGGTGNGVTPPWGGGMKEAGFKEIRTSITNRQNTVAQYIATRPLLGLCIGTKQIEGVRVSRRRWDQKGVDWETSKERVAETDSESSGDALEEYMDAILSTFAV